MKTVFGFHFNTCLSCRTFLTTRDLFFFWFKKVQHAETHVKMKPKYGFHLSRASKKIIMDIVDDHGVIFMVNVYDIICMYYVCNKTLCDSFYIALQSLYFF